MFEVGRDYRIKTIELAPDGETVSESVWKIVAFEGTLIKLQNPHSKDLILNSTSPHFVSAELL
jgi:hypothetical protein